MKYSIIIPTLNEEKLLPNLLNQLNDDKLRNEFDYEIIVSDGGSTDRTSEIALKNADKLSVHTKEHSQNISEGRNAGAHQADADILIFLNSDVEVEHPFALLTKVRDIFEHSKYLAMTCNVIVFPNESKFIDKVFQNFYNNYFHLLNIIGLGMGRGECQVIRKEVFEDMNGYNQNLAAGEDFDLFKRIRREGKILFCRDLFIHESPRRYRKVGHFRILFTWLLNSIFVIFKNKSLSKTWEQIR